MGYGIDIGSSALKVVHVKRTMKGFKIIGAARKRMPKGEKPDDIKNTVGKSLREMIGVKEGRVGVIGLSGRDINLKLVQQPNMKALNYRTMMGYEVDQARGSENDLYGDFCTLREPDPYFPNYLAIVGIGKSSYVDERIGVAAGAAIDVRDAVPTPFALFAAYKNSYGDENGTILLLDIGADNTDLAMVRGGRLIFCRNVSTGARVFDTTIAATSGLAADDAESSKIHYGNLGLPGDGADQREDYIRPAVRTAAGQLVGFIQSSISFSRTQLDDKDLAIDKIYVSGGGAKLRGLPGYLQSALKLPVELLDPFKNIDLGIMADNDDFKTLPTDMTGAIGLAQLSTETKSGATLSIIPDHLKKRRNFFRGPLFVIAAGVLLAVALIAVTVIAYARKGTAEAALAKFQADNKSVSDRISQVNQFEQELRQLIAKRRIVDSHLSPGQGLLDSIKKMRKVLPEGIFISTIELIDMGREKGTMKPPRRVVFSYPGRGIVEGITPAHKQSEQGEFKVRVSDSGSRDPEAFPGAEGVIYIDAPWLAIEIRGEIDDAIKGGAMLVLDDIKLQFTDPMERVVAEVYAEGSSARPGWQTFRLVLRNE